MLKSFEEEEKEEIEEENNENIPPKTRHELQQKTINMVIPKKSFGPDSIDTYVPSKILRKNNI